MRDRGMHLLLAAGVNWPLRGEKHSNWEGAMRAAAFVSGGFVPAALRGSHNPHTTHLVDWYATFAGLAGVAAADDPPEPAAKPDPARPFANIYGERSFPPSDSVDIWPMITNPSAYPVGAAHPYLPLTKEVMLSGQYKLLVSQPYFKSQQSGWRQPDGTWRPPNASETVDCMGQDLSPAQSFFPAAARPRKGAGAGRPCLFDVRADPGEHVDLSADLPDVVAKLWARLNASVGYQRDCNGWTYEGTAAAEIPGPRQPDGSTSCSPPERLGHCNETCADAKWAAYGKPDGPICAVPGCENARQEK